MNFHDWLNVAVIVVMCLTILMDRVTGAINRRIVAQMRECISLNREIQTEINACISLENDKMLRLLRVVDAAAADKIENEERERVS